MAKDIETHIFTLTPLTHHRRYEQARSVKARTLWGRVDITLPTSRGNLVKIAADRPITTPVSLSAWKRFRGHLVVVGLAFLEGHSIDIDIDAGRLRIDT